MILWISVLLQKALQESMSDEHTKRVEYEAIASEKDKQLQYVSQDLHQCKNFLAKEKTCTEKLRGDINTLQVQNLHFDLSSITNHN